MANLLKRLELNGFKSFAQKTTFDFSHGVTAIVGPNGSGKSNVIDAVRWLLGEREAKNLRGAKAEDLIFAGTAKRARMGQAQASLYLENYENFFPAEYSEIVVTRQVSRDGTNQYFLNKAEIRLRDLIDFFAKARLGTKGFIVVTQGNSDVFIQSSPEARREMIEEMLGLREYQLKRAEAERRLKNTEINLDKVKALTEEILPHLRSLKRQTGRWAKRGELAEELKQLEDGFFGAEYAELSRGIAAVQAEVAERAKQLAELQKERHIAEEHLKRVEAAQPEERKELQEVKRRTEDIIKKRNELQKELGRLEAQVELATRETVSAGLPPVGTLTSLLRDVRSKLEGLMEHDIDPEDFRASVHEIIEDIDAVIAERKASARPSPAPAGVQEELQKMTAQLSALERDLTALRDKEKALEKGQEDFYHTFKSAVAALEAAKDKVERWEAGTREKKFEEERLSLRLGEWKHQVEQTGRKPEEFHEVANGKSQMANGHGERSETERRMFRLRGELAAMGEVDEALLKEAHETETRYTFLEKESADLASAKDDLRALITDLNEKIGTEFTGALQSINDEFGKFFEVMFGGGTAKLKLAKREKRHAVLGAEEVSSQAGEAGEVKDAVKIEAEEEPPEVTEGIEIEVKLPRKRINSLDVLSGGERSLVGIAALFALVSVSPPPFLVLDEIDAALDERNARRFSEMLNEFSKKTQFILVTHNRATMESADVLYGITLSDDGSSKAVSLKLESRS
jgi:chromosome segregation protein